MPAMQSLILIGLAVLIGCEPQLSALDLTPPRVIRTTLPTTAVISTTPMIEVLFSEPVDPDTLDREAVVVLPHRLGSRCTLDFACGAGRCFGGYCQYDPVSSRLIRDLLSPPLSASRRSGLPQLLLNLREPSRLEIFTQRPLTATRLHAFVLTPALTDLAGNPLGMTPGEPKSLALRQDFMTGSTESGRPTVWLRSPAPGELAVPTNLARVVIGSSEPLSGVSSNALWVEVGSGQRAPVQLEHDPPICRGRPSGTCHVLRLMAPLPPLAVARLRAGAPITDVTGQPVLPPGPAQAFSSGQGPDSLPPRPAPLSTLSSDGCVVIRISTKEPTDLNVQGSWGQRPPASVAALRHEVGMRLPTEGGIVHLTLRDLAGNQADIPPIRPSLSGARGPVITEVLANPAGPEPSQELVELYNPTSKALDLHGYTLDDNDDGVGASTLPAATLGPGRFAVVVGKGYTVGLGADPPIADGALLVRLAQGLGAGGLSNAGETLALRDPLGRLVSSYGNHHQVGAKALNGRSVERVSVEACDVSRSWQLSASGASTPGGPAAKVAVP